jgi:moderate conductance mechanosensitive channel
MPALLADINWDNWIETLWTRGARVLIVLIVLYVSLRILDRVVPPAVRRGVAAQMPGAPEVEIDKRAETIAGVIQSTAGVIAIVIALLTILPEFGVSVTALLASVGVVGIAIAFGAQSLVRDILAGLFILFENHYGRGDVIRVAGVEGLVESVELRRTVLRDLDGTVHNVPNGTITVSSNLTRAWSRVNVVASVAYDEDLDRVFAVIDRTGQELASDPEWSEEIIKPPKALGVEKMNETGIDVRVLGDTRPTRQWDVMRELRARLKKAFDAEGIKAGT